MGRRLIALRRWPVLALLPVLLAGALLGGWPVEPAGAATGTAPGDAFGPLREIFWPDSNQDPRHTIYLDLEQHRLVNVAAQGDLLFRAGAMELALANGQGISQVNQAFEEITPGITGVTYRSQAAAAKGDAFLVRTRSGRLAKLQVVGVDAGFVQVRYAVTADRPEDDPGMSGRATVSFGPLEQISLAPAGAPGAMADLEAGRQAGSPGEADIRWTEDRRLTAANGLGLLPQGPVSFETLSSFYRSGFRYEAEPQLGHSYIVATRNGRYAKVQVVRQRAGELTLRVARQEGEVRDADQEGQGAAGLALYSVSLPAVSADDQGLDVSSGRLVPSAQAHVLLMPGGRLMPGGAAAGIVQLGARYLDTISTVPDDNYRTDALPARSNYTYAVRTGTGTYAIFYVLALEGEQAAYLEVVYQSDGSRSFFLVDEAAGVDGPPAGERAEAAPPGAQPQPQLPPMRLPVQEAVPPDAAAGGSLAAAAAADGDAAGEWAQLQAGVGPEGIILSWRPAAGDPLGYMVNRIESPDAIFVDVLHGGAFEGTSFIDSTAARGIRYYYAVQPVDRSGQLGPLSPWVPATWSGGEGSPVSAGERHIWLQIDNQEARVDGEPRPLALAPRVLEGRTMVPLRFVAEALGADVNYEAATRRIDLELNGRAVELVIGRQTAWAMGQEHPLDVAPAVFEGVTLVPLRFVAEVLGATVHYDQPSRSIDIHFRW